MTDFSFKDDAEKIAPTAPTPTAPTPTAPTPTAPTPTAPTPTAPTPTAPTPTAPTPNIPLPTAPKPAAATPNAPTPNVPLPAAPTPNVPLPNAPTPNAPTPPSKSPAAPTSSAPQSQKVMPTAPAPIAPIAPTPGSSQAPRPQAASPQAALHNVAARPQSAQTSAQPKVAVQPKSVIQPHAQTQPHEHTTSASQAGKFHEIAAGALETGPINSVARESAKFNAQANTWHRVLDLLSPVAFWILRVAALLGGLALAYLLWGVFSGALQSAVGNTGQTVNNIRMAISVLNWSLLGISFACLVLLWEEKFVAIVTVGVGLLLYFGAAPLIAMAGSTLALRDMAMLLQKGGLPLLVMGGLKYGLDMMRWVIDLPNRMRNVANVGVAQRAEPRQQREAQSATMFSPCWKLPFCREVIRKQCPAYVAKTTCWKFGRGCYCDEEMISRIIRGESLDTIKAPTRMSRQGKPPCGRCYIFLEHQSMKYRAFSPLAIPFTAGVMYFGWSTYVAATGRALSSLSFLWDKLAFHSPTPAQNVQSTQKQLEKAASTLSPEAVQYAAQTTVGILLGFLLLIYVSKAIEWAIYKARL